MEEYKMTDKSSQRGSAGATMYTVTFNTQGGSTVPSQSVESGQSASRPDDPYFLISTEGAVNHYKPFDNWYTAAVNGTVYDFTLPITKNTTLYARWTNGESVVINNDGVWQLGLSSAPVTKHLDELIIQPGASVVAYNTAVSMRLEKLTVNTEDNHATGSRYQFGFFGVDGGAGVAGARGATGAAGAEGSKGTCKGSGGLRGHEPGIGATGSTGANGGSGSRGENGLASLAAIIRIGEIAGSSDFVVIETKSGSGGKGGQGGQGGQGGKGGHGGGAVCCCAVSNNTQGTGGVGGVGGIGGKGGDGGDAANGGDINFYVPLGTSARFIKSQLPALPGEAGKGGLGGNGGDGGDAYEESSGHPKNDGEPGDDPYLPKSCADYPNHPGIPGAPGGPGDIGEDGTPGKSVGAPGNIYVAEAAEPLGVGVYSMAHDPLVYTPEIDPSRGEYYGIYPECIHCDDD
jgi:hypothetical protein